MCWHVTVRLWCGIIKNFFSERDVPSTKKPLKENRCLNVFLAGRKPLYFWLCRKANMHRSILSLHDCLPCLKELWTKAHLRLKTVALTFLFRNMILQCESLGFREWRTCWMKFKTMAENCTLPSICCMSPVNFQPFWTVRWREDLYHI